jgi:hypothetical protein
MAPNHIKFKGSNFFFKENQGAALSLTTPATNPPIKDHTVVKLQKLMCLIFMRSIKREKVKKVSVFIL